LLHSCLYNGVSGSACGLFITLFSKESYICELLARLDVKSLKKN
jgi:hypothetical protein